MNKPDAPFAATTQPAPWWAATMPHESAHLHVGRHRAPYTDDMPRAGRHAARRAGPVAAGARPAARASTSTRARHARRGGRDRGRGTSPATTSAARWCTTTRSWPTAELQLPGPAGVRGGRPHARRGAPRRGAGARDVSSSRCRRADGARGACRAAVRGAADAPDARRRPARSARSTRRAAPAAGQLRAGRPGAVLPGRPDQLRVPPKTAACAALLDPAPQRDAAPGGARAGPAAHKVQVECRRMGGGFGGKESQSALFACVAAVAARRLRGR
jgi:hypothetical protein